MTAGDVALMLTAVSTAAIVAAAFFAYRTWRVYEQLRDLAATSNEILDRTAEVANRNLRETRQLRFEGAEPRVVLNYLSTGGSGRPTVRRSKVEVVNDGVGDALTVRVEVPGARSGAPIALDLLKAGKPEQAELLIDTKHFAPGTSAPDLRARILYTDRYGRELETVQKGARVVVLARELQPEP